MQKSVHPGKSCGIHSRDPLAITRSAVPARVSHPIYLLFGRKGILWASPAARGASLEPDAFDHPVPHVQALVRDGVDASQVNQPIIRAIMIDVMDLIAIWDRTMGGFPNAAVLAIETAVIVLHDAVTIVVDECEAWRLCSAHAREIAPRS